MVRLLFKVWLLLGIGAALFAWLSSQGPPLPVPAPSPNAASLGTPLGDAGFRIQCTYALRERVADRSDWPLRRVAALCRCIADRIREGEARRLLASGSSGLPARLSALEAQLCR